MEIQNIQIANSLFTKDLAYSSSIPILVVRPGIGGDTFVPVSVLLRKLNIDKRQLIALDKVAGIYFRTPNLSHPKDRKDVITYSNIFAKYINEASYIACFPNYNSFPEYADVMKVSYSRLPAKQRVHNRILEPFYLESQETWLNSLKGKRVLIVSPFVDEIKQ